MKLPTVFMIALGTYFLGMGTGVLVFGPSAKSKLEPQEKAAPPIKEEDPNKELTLALTRSIELSTFTHGQGQMGSLEIKAKESSGLTLPESDRLLVERGADRLAEMHAQQSLVGTNVDRVRLEAGVATAIRVSGVDAPRKTRLTLLWDASTGNADRIACVKADLNTGKITDVSFLASDGRWRQH